MYILRHFKYVKCGHDLGKQSYVVILRHFKPLGSSMDTKFFEFSYFISMDLIPKLHTQILSKTQALEVNARGPTLALKKLIFFIIMSKLLPLSCLFLSSVFLGALEDLPFSLITLWIVYIDHCMAGLVSLEGLPLCLLLHMGHTVWNLTSLAPFTAYLPSISSWNLKIKSQGRIMDWFLTFSALYLKLFTSKVCQKLFSSLELNLEKGYLVFRKSLLYYSLKLNELVWWNVF